MLPKLTTGSDLFELELGDMDKPWMGQFFVGQTLVLLLSCVFIVREKLHPIYN